MENLEVILIQNDMQTVKSQKASYQAPREKAKVAMTTYPTQGQLKLPSVGRHRGLQVSEHILDSS